MSDNFDSNTYQEDNEKGFFAKIIGLIGLIFAPINLVLSFMPRKVRIVTILLATTFLLVSFFVATRPQAQKRPTPETVVTVEVIEATRSDYPIVVDTNGTIQANTRGNLVSQIRGEIVSVSESFKNGGAFSKGDILIEVDQRDYRAEVSQALSAVSQAKASLKQEQALAKQAKTDWERLGNAGSPPSLVAREPQLAAAKAQLESAEARYQTAKLNLERTNIRAPYSGRVIRRNAVLGQYVGVGTNLAEIFATDGVEVRLPLSQEEYSQLGLDQLSGESERQFKVELSSKLGPNTYTWDAFVTRSDSTFDLNTRQIDIIAEVVDPFSKDGTKPPLKIGQFVNASVQGRSLDQVITVPNKSLREGSYVFTSQDKKLVRTPITLSWQDDQNAVIESGLTEGDIVVTTSLNSTLAGASVKFQNRLQTESQAASEAASAEIIEKPADETPAPSTAELESAAADSQPATESAPTNPAAN
ncbi:MAG: efflux RND transporter periplasmic adaptor subunit [Gammaproteobacteria bacterium]|nr:efflux RND transporter periplasmic adaptor subunit [Gammaproteobacteria bacterium]